MDRQRWGSRPHELLEILVAPAPLVERPAPGVSFDLIWFVCLGLICLGLGFKMWGVGLRVEGVGLRVEVLGLRV